MVVFRYIIFPVPLYFFLLEGFTSFIASYTARLGLRSARSSDTEPIYLPDVFMSQFVCRQWVLASYDTE